MRHYLHLDHGACGIEGPTDPMRLRDEHIEAKVEVPRKCARCRYLKYVPIFGFVCSKDADKWGDFYRGLDWGNWKPDNLFLQLPFPKITTKDLSKHANNDDLIQFIKEYRRVNPGTSIEEVKNDFFRFREILTKQLRDHSESE